MIYSKLLYLTLCSMVVAYAACDKPILDNDSDTNHLVISTLEDAQALMDNMEVMSNMPALGEISSNDYFLPDMAITNIDLTEFNAYTWQPDIYFGRGHVADWDSPYKQVFYANTVLEALPGLKDFGNKAYKNRIEGAAYFVRALAFFQVAQLFTKPYNSATAATDAGIPLRLSSNPEMVSARATLQQTYDRIIEDLNRSVKLLPLAMDHNRKNRPSQAAAYALLARTRLIMGDYQMAFYNADSALQLHARLTDYNDAVQRLPKPFTPNEDEVMYQANLLTQTDILNHPEFYIDSLLYRSYADNDLRKDLYFTTNSEGYAIPGYNYSGRVVRFAGLATDEVLLIKAECEARLGNYQAAMNDLNALLEKRMKTGTFIPVAAGSSEEALNIILLERRKELVLRGLRWNDIRRLHREKPGTILTRVCKGQVYQITGNDPRLVLPIPPDVIRLSGIEQNPR